MKYIASCSFGKDSLATVILAKIHNEPLDAVVYARVMYDQHRSAEVPEHEEFIQNGDSHVGVVGHSSVHGAVG